MNCFTKGAAARHLWVAAACAICALAAPHAVAQRATQEGAAPAAFVSESVQRRLSGPDKATATARVIVSFDTARGRDVVDPAPAEIVTARAALLDALAPGTYRAIASYSHINAVALDIDALALAKLRADPRVQAVNENAESWPTMVEANLWTGLVGVQVADLTGLGITVAVIDSGVDNTHPALIDDMVGQKCFRSEGDCPAGPDNAVDQDGHGTHVTGIITGPNGVAPDAQFHALKVITTSNVFDDNLLSALNHVLAHPEFGIRLVNISIGGGGYSTRAACDANSRAFVSAFARLNSAGVTVFVSSGNEGWIDQLSRPACVSGAVAVGSTGDAIFQRVSKTCTDNALPNKVSCYSNAHPLQGPGEMLDLLAPGCKITSTGLAGSVNYEICGTSMASPYAAGVAALVLQYDIGTTRMLTPPLLEEHLEQTGLQVTDYRMASPGNGPFPIVNPLQAIQPLLTAPRHDLVANARIVVADSYADLVPYAQYATESGGDPVHACTGGPGSHSVWYAFTPARTGRLDLNTVGSRNSMQDTALSIYTGSNAALAPYQCNDNGAGDGLASRLDNIVVAAGTRYMIKLSRAGNASTTSLGTLKLNFYYLADPVVPPHDLVPNAKVISAGPYNDTSLDMQLATVSAGDPGHACVANSIGTHNVWYAFTPLRSGVIDIDTVGSSGTMEDTMLSVFTGVPGAFVSAACNDDIPGVGVASRLSSLAVVAGTRYTILVSRFNTVPTNVPGTLKLAFAYRSNPQPEITVFPLALAATLPAGSRTEQTLTLFSSGAQALDWTIPVAQPASVTAFQEGFADITQLAAAGWARINRSNPLGTTAWFQGTAFDPQQGAPGHSIEANYLNAAGSGDISNWLLTPEVGLDNGVQLSFWTRAQESPFADRLEVRLSDDGATTNVGSTSAGVGNFDRLLLTINPNLGPDYPKLWTRYTVAVENLAAPATGRFAFRYQVTNSGPNGTNGSVIGIDTVQFSSPCRGATWLTAAPAGGTIPGGTGADRDVIVTMNSAGLGAGIYQATLCIRSNDAVYPVTYVPVTMTVEAGLVAFADGFEDPVPVKRIELGDDGSKVIALPVRDLLADVVAHRVVTAATLLQRGVRVGMVQARCDAIGCEARVLRVDANGDWRVDPWTRVDAEPLQLLVGVVAGALVEVQVGSD